MVPEGKRAAEGRPLALKPPPAAFTTRATREMGKVDARLIAMARGELEPDGSRATSLLPTRPPPLPRESRAPRALAITSRPAAPACAPGERDDDDDVMEVEDEWLLSVVELDGAPQG